MTRRKSLKGNRQAQRNYMAKELHKKQYHGRAEKSKKKYNRREEQINEILDDHIFEPDDGSRC